VPLATCIQKVSPDGKKQQNRLLWQHPLRDQETNFRLIICSHSSANPEKLANISLVNFEITGLTEIVKKQISNRRKKYSLATGYIKT